MAEYDHLLRHAQRPRVPPRRAESEAPQLPHPIVFQYRLTDQPDAWLYMIAGRGADLERARDKLAAKFGADRLLEVREVGG